MTTMTELLAEQKHLTNVINRLENKDRLGYDGLAALRSAREDLWDVKEQIAKEEGGA